MFLRPMRSEVVDQPMRPAMLAADSRATNPAAAVADTGAEVSAKKSVIIGAAFSRMPMPAVTLRVSTSHSSQNCGVRTAERAETCGPLDTVGAPATGAAVRGTRTSSTPSSMNTA